MEKTEAGEFLSVPLRGPVIPSIVIIIILTTIYSCTGPRAQRYLGPPPAGCQLGEIHRYGNGGSERPSDLPRVTQLLAGWGWQ